MPKKSSVPFVKTALRTLPRGEVQEIARDFLGLGRHVKQLDHASLLSRLIDADCDELRAYVGYCMLSALGLEQTPQTQAAQDRVLGEKPGAAKATKKAA